MKDGIENAKITGTMIGIEDHGISIIELDLDYGGSAQALQRTVSAETLYGDVFAILQALHVSSWEELPGTLCRVRREDGLARQVGHILEDTWTQFAWR